MNTKYKILLTLSFVLTLGSIALNLYGDKVSVLGSIGDTSQAYIATTTRQAGVGTAMTATGANPKLLCKGAGTFGSVVITGVGVGTMDFYDATTSGSHSDYTGTTTLASFFNSTAAGTYTFDAEVKRGVLFVADGAMATATITCKR